MQLFLGCPEEQKADGNDEQLDFVRRNFAHIMQQLFDGFLTAGDFFDFRGHEEHHDMVKRKAHEQGEGRSGDEPVHPRDVDAELAADEVDSNHVLRCGSFDADVPDTVDLRYCNHEHSGEAAFERYAEGADHAEDDRHEAGNAGCGARNKEAEDEAAADNTDDDVVRFCAKLGEHHERDTLVEPCLRHGCCEKEGSSNEAEGRAGKALESHAEPGGGAEYFACGRVGRKAD